MRVVKREPSSEVPGFLVELDLPGGRLVLSLRYRLSPNETPEISEWIVPEDGLPVRLHTFEDR